MRKNIYTIISVILILATLFSTTAFAAARDGNDGEKIITDKDLYTLSVNDVAYIRANLNAETGTNITFTFKSMAPNIVTVDNNGRIVGINPGTTTVKITASSGASTEVFVTVNHIPVAQISSFASKTTLYVGETADITNTFDPINATRKFVKYESSNQGIIYVDDTGKILAAGVGTATVTITSVDDDSVFTTIDFLVNRVPSFDVEIPAEMLINETAEIAVTTKYDLAYTITHLSSNPSVVTINEDGTISSASEGKAEISTTIVLSDGYEITQKHTIIVDDPETAPRCSMCDAYEASIGSPVEAIYKIFHAIVHFFSELFA